MTEATTTLQVQNAQRSEAKKQVAKRATLQAMRGKKPRIDEFAVRLNPENKDEEPISFLFKALPPHKMDELLAAHPPTDEQQAKLTAQGRTTDVNIETFPPALLAVVCKEPALSQEDWASFWDNDAWSRAEIEGMYYRAMDLCRTPLDLAPLELASAATAPTGSSSSTATSTDSPTPSS